MSDAITIEKPAETTVPEPAPFHPSRVRAAALQQEFLDLGMHHDCAVHAAYWKVTFEVIEAGAAADAYEAEAVLREADVRPPLYPRQRWTRLRASDRWDPGCTRPVRDDVPVSEPARGWTPDERRVIGQSHRRDVEMIMSAWRRVHGRAIVPARQIAPEIREIIAGGKVAEWMDEDFAAFLLTLRRHVPADDLIFDVVGWRPGEAAKAFALDFPPLSMRQRPADPAFEHWVDRINRRVKELRDDCDFRPGSPLEERIATADRQALEEAWDAWAAEYGTRRPNAREAFSKAGIDP